MHLCTLQYAATHCNTLQYTATHCNTLHFMSTEGHRVCALVFSLSLQHAATHCNTLQHAATHCNTLQHTATRCNTLQHTALYLALSCFLFHSRAHAHSIPLSLTHTRSSVFFLQRARFPAFYFIVQHWRRIRLFPTSYIQLLYTYCNTLQHTATHCNTLQHTAPHCIKTGFIHLPNDGLECDFLRFLVIFW